MLKLKTFAFVAMIALAAWAIAAVVAPVGPKAQGVAPVQIDTIDLMSKAGELPVQTAPAF